MTKADKRTLVVVSLIFVTVMIAIFWDYVSYAAHKAKDIASGNADGSKIPGGTDGNVQPGSGNLSWNMTLKKGVYDSAEVKFLQQLLNQVQPTGIIAEDGDFGPKTEYKLFSVTGKKEITLQQAYAMLQNLFQ